MGVPNTNTFSLADVIAVVNPTTNDLQDCFNDASTAAFNTTYDENKDQLDDFRDYGNNGSSQSQVTIANNNYTSTNVCSQSQSYSCYKSGSTAVFENGNKIWYDTGSGPGSPFAGNTSVPDLEWYGGGSGTSKVKFQINASGVVYNVQFCSLPSLVLSDVFYYINGTTPSTPFDVYYNSDIGAASNLSPKDILYTDANLTTPLGTHSGYGQSNRYYQWGSSASTTFCSAGGGLQGNLLVSSSSTGVIQNLTCGLV